MKNPKPPFLTLAKLRSLVLLIALLLVAGNAGYRMGQRNLSFAVNTQKGIILNSSPPPSKDVDFSLFWDVWTRLEQKYLDKTKLDTQKMVYGAISGMVNSLGDPYTVFLPPKDNSDFKNDLSGAFEGIGAQLGSKDNKIVVIAPLKDHPAEKAGLLPGDWIVKVDNEDTNSWTVPQAVNKIRGPKGSTVSLTILHEGQQNTVDIKVIRSTITIKSAEVEFRHSNTCSTNCPEVADIKLSRFGDQTNDEWNAVVNQIRSKLSDPLFKGVILDLRNNPGGYFQSAIYVASEFIRSGVVVQQENSDGTRETFSTDRVGSLLDTPLVILINKGSASAAEIVAGALKDHGRGKLLGETTFGKGSVQTPEDLADGSGLHITTARWIMPKGTWINGTGISPDTEVKTPEATGSATVDTTTDLQFERALEQLVK